MKDILIMPPSKKYKINPGKVCRLAKKYHTTKGPGEDNILYLIKDISNEPHFVTKTIIKFAKQKRALNDENQTMEITEHNNQIIKVNCDAIRDLEDFNPYSEWCEINDININKEIKGKNKDEINAEFTWEFNETQYKNLIKYKIEIALGRTYAIKSMKVKGKGELPLRNLRSSSSMYESVKLKMESGKEDTSIDIEIKLRSPIIDKEYEDDFRDIIKIEKIYPEFKFNT